MSPIVNKLSKFNCLLVPFLIIIFSHLSIAQQKQLTIAVLDFHDNSPMKSEDMGPLQQGLASMMITTFSQVQILKVVERSQLNSIMEEMALGQSGVLDESSAQRVGLLLGAHYLVLGSFIKGFKDDIRIDCRIVRTETGVTVKAEEVSGKLKNLIRLMSKLGDKVVKDLDVKLSSKEKQAIKQLDSKCANDVLMDYFKAIELFNEQKYRKADGLLTAVIKKCPEFKRAIIVRRKLRTLVKQKIQQKRKM